MWATIAKYLGKALVWSVENPEQAKAVVDNAISVAEKVKRAKAERDFERERKAVDE